MANKPNVAKQDPAEGSREIVERELKRQANGKGLGPGAPRGSAGQGSKRKQPKQTHH